MRLWNVEAGKKVALRVASADKPLRVYSCGPTVYAPSHLGHARAYVTLDLLRRSRLGQNCFWAMGVTDVDDKLIAVARRQGTTLSDVAKAQEKDFFRDMDDLRVLRPHAVLRVSEHMPQIVEMVERLLSEGAAYVSGEKNDQAYFDLVKYGPSYGRLDSSRRIQEGERDETTGDKRDGRDFALWKPASEDDVLAKAAWPSRWGMGRPGWHIECSAMSTAMFGPQLDLHTGGIDLRFPHHENEIAQTEAACLGPRPWCSQWLHLGHLHMTGRKMSKSLKNFVSIREFLESGGSPDLFRIFCLMHRYGDPVEWGDGQLEAARTVYSELDSFVQRASADARRAATDTPMQWTEAAGAIHQLALSCWAEVDDALNDDFDTPRALASLRGAIQASRKHAPSGSAADGASTHVLAAFAREVAQVVAQWGVELSGSGDAGEVSRDGARRADAAVDELVKFRSQVREMALGADRGNALRGGLLGLCDGARGAAAAKGLAIEDVRGASGASGSRWAWIAPKSAGRA